MLLKEMGYVLEWTDLAKNPEGLNKNLVIFVQAEQL
jgi:hypothetical protein